MTQLWTDQVAGPASYATGGFVVATSLASIAALDVEVSDPSSTLGQCHFAVALNQPAAGQATVRVLRDTYQKLSLGAPSGLPSGVTAPTTSGQNVVAESGHTHDLTHGHAASAASGLMQNAAGQVTQALTGGVNTSTHTHTVTVPSAAFTTGAGPSHTHTWNNIYQHQHAVTNTASDATLIEVAAATNLSAVVLNISAVD